MHKPHKKKSINHGSTLIIGSFAADFFSIKSSGRLGTVYNDNSFELVLHVLIPCHNTMLTSTLCVIRRRKSR